MGCRAQTIWYKIFAKSNNQSLSLEWFCYGVLTLSCESRTELPTFAHKVKESLARTLASTELAPEGLEGRNESPQGVEVPTAKNINEGPKVCKELLYIDHSTT